MKVLASTMMVVWWCMMMMVLPMKTSVMALEVDECDQQLGFNTVSYDLQKGIRCYPKFLTRLRNQVQAPTRACGFPSTRIDPLIGNEYLTVDLKITDRQWVSLGIDVKDLYIWGYQDKYNGTLRATFVHDVPLAARTALFPSATIRRNTTFEGNYVALERYARIDKKVQQLTIKSLENAILRVYGKPETQLNNADEAKFFLLVIQMVSEAARFKFIENGIAREDETQDFKLKLVGFINDWDKISDAIHIAEAQSINKCTVIFPAIEIGNIEYTKTVSNVDDIREDMALLKYKRVNYSFPSA